MKLNEVQTKGERCIALQVVGEVPTSYSATIEELQEQISLLTCNFKRAFKKDSKRFKKTEATRSNPKTISKGVVIKEETEKEKKNKERKLVS